MNPNLSEGAAIIAKDTQTIRSCGVIPGAASGHITCTKNSLISFYLKSASVNNSFSKSIEVRCSYDLFAANFKLHPFLEVNKGYISGNHASKFFPGDFINI